MGFRMLCVGDLHLGRRPPRLPLPVRERFALSELGPAAAWRSTVDLALREAVDAVLLAGDVVDQSEDFFEAYRELEAGVVRLTERGIPVLAVAGNHDVAVLPRLAESIGGFRLLGAGGHWEQAEIDGSRGARVTVLGWSFPASQVRDSPLDYPHAGLLDAPPPGAAAIGLLHCDLDRRQSGYAPVGRRALQSTKVDTWLLGHIHRPGSFTGSPQLDYLGSVLGLDPGETGAHGPWMLESEGPGPSHLCQLPLAPLRWESRELEIEAHHQPEDAERMLVELLESVHRQLDAVSERPKAVGLRVAIVGRTGARGAIAERLVDNEELWIEREGTVHFVHRVGIRTRPVIDIESLAQTRDPAGLLARKLLVLQAPPGDPQREALVAAAADRLQRVALQPQFRRLGEDEMPAERVAEILETATLQALDALLEQRR